MKKSELLKLVADWMDETIAGTDLELVDLEYVKEGGNTFAGLYRQAGWCRCGGLP